MSTSLWYHSFGIRGYEYVRTEYRGGQVIFTIDRRVQDPPVCSVRGEKGTILMLQISQLLSRSHRHHRGGRIAILRPLEMDVVYRVLKELGGIDEDGSPTLERGRVEFRDGYLVCPSRIGGWHNRTAEEFALRLQHETACTLADREH